MKRRSFLSYLGLAAAPGAVLDLPCPRCKWGNSIAANFCGMCGAPMRDLPPGKVHRVEMPGPMRMGEMTDFSFAFDEQTTMRTKGIITDFSIDQSRDTGLCGGLLVRQQISLGIAIGGPVTILDS